MKRLAALAGSLACLALHAATPTPGAPHSMTAPLGPQAQHVLQLWNVFVVTCAVVFGAILAVLVLVLWKRPRSEAVTPPDLASVDAPEPRLHSRVTSAVVASALLLVALVVASFFTDRALARLNLDGAVHLEVTAHQWWWSATYLDGDPDRRVEAVNEIHIPTGRPVIVRLKSSDVIHSLWVPNLSGKKDLIPGRTAIMQFRADAPGTYRGQCAEFCGFQHALMGLVIVAEPPDRYAAWQQAALQPAPQPATALARRGQELFQSVSCAMCHAIAGTAAQGRQAPDLTHVASRQTLGAGTLANTPENLASWIADPHKHKPGVNMPANPMSAEDLAALVAYLGTLK